MHIYEPNLWLIDGVLKGDNVEHSYKYLKDVKNLYEKPYIYDKYSDDTIVYEVYSYSCGNKKIEGNLYWGITVMYPMLINGECNMTRGHFHENKNCAEYYFGITGEGLLLRMDEDGRCFGEKILPGSLHYIDGKVAHRIINIGDEMLKVGACWPTTAGHDYASVESMQFPYRICRINGELIIKER